MRSPNELTLFAEASLAKIFLRQEKEPESKGKSQVSSMSLFESCGLLDPSTSSSKIPLQLLGAVSELSSKKLPKAGMMRNGQLYQRESVAPLICATAGGPFVKDKIPTPTVRGDYNRKGLSKTSGDGLATWVKKMGLQNLPGAIHTAKNVAAGTFPTPTCVDAHCQGLEMGAKRVSPRLSWFVLATEDRKDLAEWIGKTMEPYKEDAAKTGLKRNGVVEVQKKIASGKYATPKVWDADKEYTPETLFSRLRRESPDLAEQVFVMEIAQREREKLCGKGYPDTLPVYIANSQKKQRRKGLETIAYRIDAAIKRDSPQLAIQVSATSPAGGKLNPLWVEWLMGFPIGWTDLKD